MSGMRLLGGLLVCALSGHAALADTPSFDRPGISFSTTTLPAGSFDWEQGLPDFAHDSDHGIGSTSYSADTTVRVGLAERLELQLGADLFDVQTTRFAGHSSMARGFGASSLGVKWALPTSADSVSWALLGRATFATGRDELNDGRTQYDLGATVNVVLDESWSAATFVNLNRLDGTTTTTLSQSFGYAFSDRLGGYVEAGADFARHGSTPVVAGGGLTYMLTPTVQLDVSADVGLNGAAPDVHGGVGVSAFFD